jgi:hypothetical protein
VGLCFNQLQAQRLGFTLLGEARFVARFFGGLIIGLTIAQILIDLNLIFAGFDAGHGYFNLIAKTDAANVPAG